MMVAKIFLSIHEFMCFALYLLANKCVTNMKVFFSSLRLLCFTVFVENNCSFLETINVIFTEQPYMYLGLTISVINCVLPLSQGPQTLPLLYFVQGSLFQALV